MRRHIGGIFKYMEVWLLRVFLFSFSPICSTVSVFFHLLFFFFGAWIRSVSDVVPFFSPSPLISVRCVVAFVVAVVPLCPQQRVLPSRRDGEAFFLSHLVNKARLGRRARLRRRGEPTEAPAMVKTNHASFFFFWGGACVCVSLCVSGSQPAVLSLLARVGPLCGKTCVAAA